MWGWGGRKERNSGDTSRFTPPSVFLTTVRRPVTGQEGGVCTPQRRLAGTAKAERRKTPEILREQADPPSSS